MPTKQERRQEAPAGRRAAPPTEVLLRRYRRTPSVAVRNQLVERHRGLVEAMAHTMAARLPASVDPQDLTHAGMWGLLRAIERYDPERCDSFTAFLRIRVRGAMLDELRHMDWLPRLWRRRHRDRERALLRLRAALAREPSPEELARELGVSVAALQRRYGEQGLVRGAAPEIGDDGSDGMDRLADEAQEAPDAAMSRRELLAKVRASLRPIEWKVLQLHYLDGMTGKEVARRLRLSASRICQIHVRVMDRLKTRLAAMAV